MPTEKSLAVTYRICVWSSVGLMLTGWLWHLQTHDVTNLLIQAGLFLLLSTPLLGILHIAILHWREERIRFWIALLVIALIGLAYSVGSR
jgi:uncharacterized membrane protein